MQVEAIAVKWQAEKMASCWQWGSAWWCQSNSVLKTLSGSQHRANATTMANSITLILWAPRVRLLRSSMSLQDTPRWLLSDHSLSNTTAGPQAQNFNTHKCTAKQKKPENSSCQSRRGIRARWGISKFGCGTCVVSGGGRSGGSTAAPARAAGSTGKPAVRSCRRGDACLRATAPCRSNGPWCEKTGEVNAFMRDARQRTSWATTWLLDTDLAQMDVCSLNAVFVLVFFHFKFL